MTKKELFKKALSKLPEAENKAHFDFLVDYFNLKEIDQILTETFPEKIRLDIVKEVNFINRYSDYADAELRADDLKLLSEIIREISGYFKEAVENNKLKKFIVTAYLIDLLNIKAEGIIDLNTYSTDKIERIKFSLQALLNCTKFSLEDFKKQNRYEAKYIENFYSAIEKSNFSYAYSFIKGIEAGINIFAFPELFRAIIRFSVLVDISIVVDLMETKIDLLELLAYFNLLTEEKVRDLINYVQDNKWLFLEFLRQISKFDGLKLTASEREILVKKLKNVALTDKIFFREIINFFKDEKSFSRLLALVLAKLDHEYLKLYLDTVKFNEYHDNLKSYQLFLETFIENTSLAEQLYLCSGVKEKWNCFLKELISEEEYLQGIIYTDYYSFVYHYYFMSLENNADVESELESILEEFKDATYGWHESFKRTRAAYFVFLTKVYILIGVAQEKEFVLSASMRDELDNVLNDQRFWLRFHDSCEKPEVVVEIKSYKN
jgi:hypothetical protein